MKYLLTPTLLVACFTTCLAQKVKLVLNLTKGNTYYMISNVNSVIVQTVNGNENAINLDFNFKMAFKVNSVADTVYNMEVSYQTLDMKIKTGGTMIEMDSKKVDAKDVSSNIVSAMMNKPFNITMTKHGKIIAVSNAENMISAVFNSFPQIDTAKKAQLKAQFMQQFGAKAIKGNLEIGTAIYPENKVSVNDKWVVNTKLESTMTALLKTTYELIAVTDTGYHISGNGVMATDANAAASVIAGMAMKYNLTGTLISDITVDKVTGWVTSLKLNEIMKGEIDIQDNPKIPGGLTMPITITSNQVTTGN